MKVAYLTTYYNGGVDGRFGRFHDWVHTLRDMEDPPFEFDVIALTASDPDGTLVSRPHAFLGEATDLWGSPRNKVEFALNLPRAARDLRTTEYDVLHVLTLDLLAYPLALALSGRSPVIGPDLQGYTPQRRGCYWNEGGVSGLRRRTNYRINGQLLGVADDPTVVALSEYHRSNVRYVDDDVSVEVIPPGVDPIFTPDGDSTEEGDPDRPTEFLYVGDLSEYKGYDLFLEALSRLPDSVDFRATVAGLGSPDRDRIAGLDLDGHVTDVGFVPRRELPDLYRSADFFVMPSVDENGPNTIVESLACGTPIVATDRPGINEYAPEGAAIYADRTPSAFSDALSLAHEQRDACARTALEHADEFRADRTVAGLADLYRDHLGRIRD